MCTLEARQLRCDAQEKNVMGIEVKTTKMTRVHDKDDFKIITESREHGTTGPKAKAMMCSAALVN